MNIADTFQAMNVDVVLQGIQTNVAKRIEAYIKAFESAVSRFKEANALAFLNQAPLDIPVYVESPLDELLKKSLRMAHETDFYVHSFVGENMKAIGYGTSFHTRMGNFVQKEFTVQSFESQPFEYVNQ